jgi:hypothetical protein
MRVKEKVQVALVCTKSKAQRPDTATNTVVTNSVVIPPEMMECLNKTEWSNASTKVNSCKVGDDSSDGRHG